MLTFIIVTLILCIGEWCIWEWFIYFGSNEFRIMILQFCGVMVITISLLIMYHYLLTELDLRNIIFKVLQ